MNRDDFMIQQYLTLRDEIRGCKTRMFWLVVLTTVLIPTLAFVADQYGSLFAGASAPFVVLVLLLAFVVEQNDIIRAGRFVRERIEPNIQDAPGWEEWLESNDRLRAVDRLFFGSILVIFMVFYAIGMRTALESVAKQWPEHEWFARVAYGIGGLWLVYVLLRHWHSCTTTKS